MTSIEIRGERPGDEEAINEVNCRAFRHADEGQIVDDMRRVYPLYDRGFSVTAWHQKEMVGHALFTDNLGDCYTICRGSYSALQYDLTFSH